MTCVIFDLDGTLADTAADLIAAANAALGRDMLGPGDHATAFRGGRAMLTLGLERMHGAADEAEIDRLYQPLLDAYGVDIARHTKLYPGTIETVRQMRGRGWRIGVCTNKPEALAVQLLAILDPEGLLGPIVGADTLPVRKPDPEHLRETVRRAGGRMEACVLVGDTSTDRETARNAQVPCILVGFGPEGIDVHGMEPEAVLDRYEDLPHLVERLLAPAPA